MTTLTATKIERKLPALSRLALGWWRLGQDPETANPQKLLAKLEAALDLGLTTQDHADIYGDYGCEALFGAALALKPSLREQMQIITKCGIQLLGPARPDSYVKHYDTSKSHIIASVERSLANLRTDRIDLLLIHRPDPLMVADEVAEAFGALYRDGKVLAFGVSNFTPFQVDLLQSRLPFALAANQVEISVMQMQSLHDGTLDQCQRLGMVPMAWSPLAGGALLSGQGEREIRLRQVMGRIGAERDVEIDQLALAWLLRHPAGILPVLGTANLERMKRSVDSLPLQLDRQQWFEIWQASAGQSVP